MPAHFDTDAENAKLASLRVKEEEDLARLMAERHSLTYTDLSVVPINMDALRVIPEADAKEAQAVAFDKSGRHLSLAYRSPDNDALKALLARLSAAGYVLQQFLISEASLELALKRYTDLSYAVESKAGVFDISADELVSITRRVSNLADLRTFLDESLAAKSTSSTSHLFEGMLAATVALKASDLHLEPEEDGVRMRLRLDGVLTDVYVFDAHAYRLMNSRIKVLSGLKLNISDRAQDGRFSIATGGIEIEVRTSIIPGNYGESVVLRILDPTSLQQSIASMGMHPKLLERLRTEINRPNGMLLTTGPTGSGKTTTLYTFLREVQTPEIKVVTIEDPIEYHLAGIVQTQTNGTDYTFASGLRSILRQDPDVIMIGEIRDSEVAEVAIQAALTGHFVFSTLHTNNASGSFPRLVDLGVDPKSFASAISVAMAQRLVRTLHPEARIERATTDEEKRIMEKVFSTLTDTSLIPTSFDTVWSAAPRTAEETGYKGRTGVHEAIFMDEELGEFLRDNPSAGDIEHATRRQGYLTLAQDGLLKALSGVTSYEEVKKVIDLPQG